MDPFTFALISGAAGFGAGKIAGLNTSDALKQGILSGATAGIFTPAAAVQKMGTATGLQNLLISGVKQGVAGRIAGKLGMDPRLGMTIGSMMPGRFPGQMPPNEPLTAAQKTADTIDIAKEYGDAGLEASKAVTIGDRIKSAGGKAADIFLKKDGKYDLDKIAKTTTLFGVPTLLYASGAFDPQDTKMVQPTYNIAYPELRQERGGLKRLQDGEVVELDQQFIPESTPGEVYAFQEKVFKAKEGGIAQFNEGGVNYLPSKTTHDEKDSTNYKRAGGYIEDGAGMGDKNEDTMLAQLADGEFVTRTDGVLGAGILAGANPKDEKDMRAKGAKYFYEQQARFKRIFDLLDANRNSKLQ